MKVGLGSSEFFTVTLVIFNDNEVALDADKDIDEIRTSLKLKPYEEFKFNKLNDTGRRSFLSTISKHNFIYYGVVINKAKLTGKGFAFKESFYKYACQLALSNCKEYLIDATIVIDGSGSSDFRRQLQKYIKEKLNDKNSNIKCVKKVKIEDSQKITCFNLLTWYVVQLLDHLLTKRTTHPIEA